MFRVEGVGGWGEGMRRLSVVDGRPTTEGCRPCVDMATGICDGTGGAGLRANSRSLVSADRMFLIDLSRRSEERRLMGA